MKIKEININELIEYDNNPRNNDESVELVANSIKEFGFKVPLVIDKNNVIIAGHTRLKASKYLGLKKVPCIIADDLTPEQIKAFRLADNKVSEKSTWNMEKLQNELLELKVIDFNIENFGFETSDIDISNVNTDEILDKFKNNITTDEIVEDEIPEVAEDPICKLGDIWLLGNHKLMCGDSTNQESVNKLFGDEISDLLITSPPYNIGDGATLRQHLEKGQKNERLNTLYNSYNDDVDYIDFIQQMYNVSKTKTKSQFINIQMLGGNKQDFIKFIYNNLNCFVDLIIWNNHTCPPQMRENILNNYFEFVLIFDNENNSRIIRYGNFRGNIPNYIETKKEKNQFVNIHKAVYSVSFVTELLKINEKADFIYDCFGGTGTTIIACEQLNKKCYMMELDPKYCDVIIKRWENFTGKKAVLLNG